MILQWIILTGHKVGIVLNLVLHNTKYKFQDLGEREAIRGDGAIEKAKKCK